MRAVTHSCLYKPGSSLFTSQANKAHTYRQRMFHLMPLNQGKQIPPSSSGMNFMSSCRQQKHWGREVVVDLQMGMSKDALAGNVFMHTCTYGSAFPSAVRWGEEGRSFGCLQEISFFSSAFPCAWQGAVEAEGGSHLDEHMKMIITAHSQYVMSAMGSSRWGWAMLSGQVQVNSQNLLLLAH